MEFLRIILCLALLAATQPLGGCSRQQAAPKPSPPPTVTVSTVVQQPTIEWHEFTGRTEAVEIVEVKPRVSGHIQEVRFHSGQMVKKGDVLFVIDPRWHQATYDRAEAEFERTKVRLKTAEREAQRTEQLMANKAISTEEADARQSRFEEARAALLASEAELTAARLDLEFTQIRAPIDGRISRPLVTAGNHISGVPGNNTLLTTIVSVDPVYVYADVDEATLLNFNALQKKKLAAVSNGESIPVEMRLGDEEFFVHQGKIESFNNRLDPGTGSILLRCVFNNPDQRIVPGLFARIRVPAQEAYTAILVDERAIGTDQGQKFVLTLTSSNTVAYRPVKLGPAIGSNQRIVRSGLQAGETIVVNGLQRARPGMLVTPQPAANNSSTATVNH